MSLFEWPNQKIQINRGAVEASLLPSLRSSSSVMINYGAEESLIFSRDLTALCPLMFVCRLFV
jgi:hypothetical protein